MRIHQFSLCFCLIIALGACSFGRGSNDDVIIEMPEEAREEITEIEPPVTTQSLEDFNRDSDGVKRLADGQIEVFDLNAPLSGAPVGSQVTPTRPDFEGGTKINDQVQVYPLSDQNIAFKQYAPRPSSNTDSLETARVLARETLYFAHGSAKLSRKDVGIIGAIALQFNDSNAGSLNVIGHASQEVKARTEEERKIKNLRMSMRRAVAVAEALISAGVPSNQIKVKALGEAQPASPRDGLNANAASRRVVIEATASR